MEDPKIYRGYLTKFLIQKGDWGLALFINEENTKSQIKIKGRITEMKPKLLYEIKGKKETHARYGVSIEVETYFQADSLTQKAAIKYLSGATFPGIGRKTAEMIAEFYQEDTIRKIKQRPESLYEITALPSHLARIIIERLKTNPLEDLRQSFYENNLSIVILDKILELTDDFEEIQSLFRNDFYSFARKNHFKPFAKIDEIALFFGESATSSSRVGHWAEAISLQLAFSSGNTFIGLEKLKPQLMKKLEIRDESTIMSGLIYAKTNQLLYFDNGKIYPSESWEDEEAIATGLVSLLQKNQLSISKARFETTLKKVETELGIILKKEDFHFDSSQVEALKTFLKAPVLLVSGGPGTGKSTLIYGFVLLYRYLFNQPSIGVATPTGRASARLKDVVEDLNPSTIHKLLEANEDGTFAIDIERPLNYELMIVDEMSMVDNHVFAQLIKAKGPLRKIVLVGDLNQLPPVNYGNLFNDLATNENFTFVELNQIHRQKNGNGIIDLASHIQQKTIQNLDWKTLTNVETYFNQNAQDNYKTLQLDYGANLNKITNSHNSYQIIAPFYAGPLGVENINNFVQESFNNDENSPKRYHRGLYKYGLNDKVMCLKNNSELDLTNGETGIIKELKFLNQKLDQATIQFNEEKTVVFNADQFDDLALSYACSVHKTQGSEYQRVVLILENNPRNFFLNRKLIYTAVTRAKEELLIIGDEKSFLEACLREPNSRLSTLSDKIRAKII